MVVCWCAGRWEFWGGGVQLEKRKEKGKMNAPMPCRCLQIPWAKPGISVHMELQRHKDSCMCSQLQAHQHSEGIRSRGQKGER